MQDLFVIGGASGSGKTAIKDRLQKKLGQTFHVADFDEAGIPSNANTKWRGKTTEAWLEKLSTLLLTPCLLGQSVLGEILACPSIKKFRSVHYLLLDVGDVERNKRLSLSNPSLANQNMLNWASWLRMHTLNPGWAPHVITDTSWAEMNFGRWLGKENWHSLARTSMCDTTHLTLDEVAQKGADFIHHQKLPCVIFLNGPSSSGKTTLAKTLQAKSERPLLRLGIDQVIQTMPDKLNDWQKPSSKTKSKIQGFWWQLEKDPQGHPLPHIRMGPYANRISQLFKHLVVTMLTNGHSVIIDEVCLNAESFQEWQSLLKMYHPIYVGLQASDALLEKREKARGDRMPGSAKAQNQHIHQGTPYDLTFNTDNLTPTHMAQTIIQFFKEKSRI